MTRKQVVTSLTAFRERIGKPIERWRQGIFSALVPRPKAGKVLSITPPPASPAAPTPPDSPAT